MLNEINSSLDVIILQTKNNANYLIDIFCVVWGSFFLSMLSGKRLLYLGIIPRNLIGIPGIFLSPFLHADFNHLFFNTIPLIVLSNFLLIAGIDYYLSATICIALISGTLTWLFAKPGIHIGASGVITGYWALLVSNIYQQGTVTAIILGIICIYYFAGIFFSVFPSKKGISWEGHLFGLIAGGLVSLINIYQ